ncbi:MAG: hypothetical protein HQK87_02870 [Nitrospinae bacterium]|nr:hypothetical protein [Nitrospinota bacterium]
MSEQRKPEEGVNPIPLHLLEAVKKKNERRGATEPVGPRTSFVAPQGSLGALRKELDEMASLFNRTVKSRVEQSFPPASPAPATVERTATPVVAATPAPAPVVETAVVETHAEPVPAPKVETPPPSWARPWTTVAPAIAAETVVAVATAESGQEAPGAAVNVVDSAPSAVAQEETPVIPANRWVKAFAEVAATKGNPWVRRDEPVAPVAEEAPEEQDYSEERRAAAQAAIDKAVADAAAEEDMTAAAGSIAVDAPVETTETAHADQDVTPPAEYDESSPDVMVIEASGTYVVYESDETPPGDERMAVSAMTDEIPAAPLGQEEEEAVYAPEPEEPAQERNLTVAVEPLGAGILHSLESGVEGAVEAGKTTVQTVGSLVTGGATKVKELFRDVQEQADQPEERSGVVAVAARSARRITDKVADGMIAAVQGIGVIAGYVVSGAVAAPVDLAKGAVVIATDLAAGVMRLVSGAKDNGNKTGRRQD